jgi:hypothetical protein
MAPSVPTRHVALSLLKKGQGGVVRAMDFSDLAKGDATSEGTNAAPKNADAANDVAYLGAMGLCCNAKVRLCRTGEPCIVSIVSGNGASCRIGLARPLAERILIEPDAESARVSS